MRGLLRAMGLACVGLVPLLGVASVRGDAVLAKTVELELPAQQATTALIQLSTLGGVQVVMRGHLLDSITAPELHGRMSIAVALERILQAVPHSIQVTQGNTVTVIVQSVAAPVHQAPVSPTKGEK